MLISENKNFCDDVNFYLKEFLRPFNLKISIQNEILCFDEIDFFLPLFLFDQELYIKSLLKKTGIKNLKFKIIISYDESTVIESDIDVIHNLPTDIYNEILFKTIYNILQSKKLEIDEKQTISLDSAYLSYAYKVHNDKFMVRRSKNA